LVRFEFESGIVSFCFSLIFVSFGESCLLVSWCASGRSRRPGAEDQGWSHRSGTRWLGDREVRWRRVRSAPGTWRLGERVFWLSLKTKVDGLSVVWPQNHWDGLSSVWASKLMVTVSEWFGLKTTWTVSSGLASKPAATVFASLA
jgi:hypothetical protein